MVASVVVEDPFACSQEPARVAEASESAFRDAMRQLARGVAIVTFGAGRDRAGFTATSLTALSSDPPSLIACIPLGSPGLSAMRRSFGFAVSLLAADQQEYAEHFAGRSALQGSGRYPGGPWRPLPSGVLCLANSIAAFDCEVEDRIERRTHAILIGRVGHVLMGTGSGALVYWRGGYDQVGWSRDQIARATGLSPIGSRLHKYARWRRGLGDLRGRLA
jgi:flavin reductase (DIM6/NTAB) family NADH-FMN oxidoreductase RutF